MPLVTVFHLDSAENELSEVDDFFATLAMILAEWRKGLMHA